MSVDVEVLAGASAGRRSCHNRRPIGTREITNRMMRKTPNAASSFEHQHQHCEDNTAIPAIAGRIYSIRSTIQVMHVAKIWQYDNMPY